jgi:hypothetical protein
VVDSKLTAVDSKLTVVDSKLTAVNSTTHRGRFNNRPSAIKGKAPVIPPFDK